MTEKRPIDASGAALLTGFALLLAFNQVVIKVTGGGFGPVFQAGLRSAIGLLVLAVWIALRRPRLGPLPRSAALWGVVAGLLFCFEFICLFIALDVTSVSRASIIFYSMPVWLALAAHLLLPGEQLTRVRSLGLVLAMGGVALAVLDRGGGTASLAGDLLALGATFGWAGIALCLRITPLAAVPPVTQLVFQLAVSAVLLTAAAPLFGPLVREMGPLHLWGLAFQGICIASLGYLLWFQLIKIYRASSVASFSFLSPVLAVLMGWALLDEVIGPQVWAALALVAAGVFLINRK